MMRKEEKKKKTEKKAWTDKGFSQLGFLRGGR